MSVPFCATFVDPLTLAAVANGMPSMKTVTVLEKFEPLPTIFTLVTLSDVRVAAGTSALASFDGPLSPPAYVAVTTKNDPPDDVGTSAEVWVAGTDVKKFSGVGATGEVGDV